MIFGIVRKSRVRSVITLCAFTLCLLAVVAVAAVLSFVFVYSVILSLIVLIAVLGLFACAISHFFKIWISERKNLFRDLELSLYGERKLVLDSIAEFDRKKEHPELVRETMEGLLKSDRVKKTLRSWNRVFLVRIALFISVTALSAATLAVLMPSVSLKIGRIRDFREYRLHGFLPDHYIEGKMLRIDLSEDYPDFDGMALVVNSNRLEGSNGVFIIDEQSTSQKRIELRAMGTKFGLQAVLDRKTSAATRQLLIEHAAMTVRYPASTGLSPEEFSGLQDLEVWSGADVELSGDVTKKLLSVRMNPSAKEEIRLENERFRLRYRPKQSVKRTLELASDDGDRLVSSEFLVKVNPNERPRIKLLFPVSDVRIGQYQWSVLSLMEGDDDQGIKNVVTEVLVTNRDVLLKRYAYKKKWAVPCPREKNIRKTVLITYKDLELLPDEVASVTFRAEDVFGVLSAPAGFSIIVPDLLDIQERNEKALQQIASSVNDVSNAYGKMREELRDKDLSGAQQQMRKVETGASNISDALGELDRNQTPGIDEIRESIQRMKEVTDSLKQNSEFLKQMLSLMQGGKEPVRDIDPGNRNMNDLLKELSSMLKNLEYYKKYSDILTQFQITKNVYEKLKNADNEKEFRRTLETYRDELEKLGSLGRDPLKDRIFGLTDESKKFKPRQTADPSQFNRSDELMQKLENDVRDMMKGASEERIRNKLNAIERIIEELFLYTVFIEDALKLDFGTTAEPNVENTKKAVETVNSVQFSYKIIKPEIENALGGIQFDENTVQGLANVMDDVGHRISFLQETLKENQIDALRPALYYLEKSSVYLFVYLVRISDAVRQAEKDQKPSEGDNRTSVLRMEDLMKMQSGMSMGLQNMMQRLQKDGKLTPQMKEEMERLANLQEEIRNTLSQMMKQNQSGVFEGGNELNKSMEDIIKDLQSYNVKKETLEKSKQIEEKLLKSKKSIESKGISDERKAEAAKTYEIRPPERNDTGNLEKLDLGSIPDKKVSEYYKKLIERYKKR